MAEPAKRIPNWLTTDMLIIVVGPAVIHTSEIKNDGH